MRYDHYIWLLSIILITSVSAYAQRGPGGVSTETPGQSTCRLWLDASTLTSLADGDDLTNWTDISLSAETENAIPGNLAPYFRDDAANAINGYPVVTFEDGRYLQLVSSGDMNLQTITQSKTVFFAFRTSADVSSTQVIYEEGGAWRGFNVIIEGGFIYVGAYDFRGNDPDNTPSWGYTYVRTAINPNTTYVLATQFYAQNQGEVNTTPNYVKGWLNGQVFDNIQLDGVRDYTANSGNPSNNLGIGSLAAHPDPIGIGAVNSDMVDKNQIVSNQSGSRPFAGRLAEMCYYNDGLGNTERNIIENYLGAKYFAQLGVIADQYDHQASYGREVIGIGRLDVDVHKPSQGRNPFLITANNISDPNEFYFTGHNGNNLLYTQTGVPNNSPNIQRLQRIWRADRRGDVGEINFQIDLDDLPPAPAGYSKLVILVDQTSENFPNFTQSSTVVEAFSNTALTPGYDYELNYDMPDDAFYTFGWLKPEVNFTLTESFSFESDPSPDSTLFELQVQLNYQTITTNDAYTVDYEFIPGTAMRVNDFNYDESVQSNGIVVNSSINPALQPTVIPVYIINDTIAENPSTESFQVVLNNGTNTTPELNIGSKDTLTYTIYDNDPPPKFSFQSATSNASEGVGTHLVDIVRDGDTEGAASLKVEIVNTETDALGAPALPDPQDYNFPAFKTVNFADGESLKQVSIDILDDDVYEIDENIRIRIYDFNGAGVESTSIIEHDITIVENDPLPVASFASSAQAGFESVGEPFLLILLDRLSSLDVEVTYDMNAGSATYEQDFDGALNGVVQFPPLNDEAFLGPFFVNQDNEEEEPDETVLFNLTSADNATIGSPNNLTYTIIDYSPFEWKGAAGIGKDIDNVVWVDADRMSGTGQQTSITNFSPRNITLNRYGGNSNRASLNQFPAINDRKALDFDGTTNTSEADCYEISNSSVINTAGFVERLSYFMVIRPDVVPNTTVSSGTTPNANHVRLIYEQGAGTRGTAIYLYNNHLYFHAWNDNNDDGGDTTPWGYRQGAGNNNARIAETVWARSAQPINANSNYIISCHFDQTSDEPLAVYVNGEKGVMSQTILDDPSGSVGKLFGHAGRNGFGAVNNTARFHFTAATSGERTAAFDGKIAEFFMFHEPQLTEPRRIILENYLSAKYAIPLDDEDTPQVFDLASASGANPFNFQVAGIGQNDNGDFHGDAQGPSSVLRAKGPTFAASNSEAYLMWGHNGETLTNTWPFSYWNAPLPPGVQERSGQVWKFFESPDGSVSNVNILINYSASANAADLSLDNSLLKLLVSDDPDDFSDASVYDLHELKNGFVVEFQNIPISNGSYIALGNASPINITPLPIELLDFRARNNGPVVDLHWTTASEVNNDYFVVERAGSDMVWKEVLTESGSGNSTAVINYHGADRNPIEGVSYYRLRQVDFDGSFTLSDVVSVIRTGVPKDQILIYPNPNRGSSTFVQLPTTMRDLNVSIRLTDLSGKTLIAFQFQNQGEIRELSHGNLNPGLYFVNIKSGSYSETKKLIIQ